MKSEYSKFHLDRMTDHIYPTEFIIRTFLGSYPKLNLNKNMAGKSVLDLGFGDGRNMPLFRNMGMNIYGIEISESICESVRERVSKIGIECELRVGLNSNIGFGDAFFDYVVACHSIYYVSDEKFFSDNLSEVARVMKDDSTLIFSLPQPDTFILEGADDIGNGHFIIRKDPFNLRNGTVFKVFRDDGDIRSCFSELFYDISLGECRDDFYGLQQNVWIGCAKRKKRASLS